MRGVRSFLENKFKPNEKSKIVKENTLETFVEVDLAVKLPYLHFLHNIAHPSTNVIIKIKEKPSASPATTPGMIYNTSSYASTFNHLVWISNIVMSNSQLSWATSQNLFQIEQKN